VILPPLVFPGLRKKGKARKGRLFALPANIRLGGCDWPIYI
jgi:hypothetical protein